MHYRCEVARDGLWGIDKDAPHGLEGFGLEMQKNNSGGDLAIEALRKGAEEDQSRADMREKGERRKKLKEEDQVQGIEEEKRRMEDINEKSVRNDLSENRKRCRTVLKWGRSRLRWEEEDIERKREEE